MLLTLRHPQVEGRNPTEETEGALLGLCAKIQTCQRQLLVGQGIFELFVILLVA